MTKQELAAICIARLKAEYPDSDCTLDYDHAWQLLVSVRLAAQCTDARVNVVVQELFAKYPGVKELAAADPRVRVINFSRNFGHEAAMLAGLDHSSGEGIVCMDADLQHPPECLPEIVRKFEEGCGVISMVRTKNKQR